MRGPRIQALGALCAYGAASFLMLGLSIVRSSAPALVGDGGDSGIFVWSMAWWPHAVSTGSDPFVTHAIWTPVSTNLAWTTAVPGAALLAWPVTALYGPQAAYNAWMVACPALAAFGAYLLAREICGRFWPALAGGWAFGFSSYMFGQELGHMHMVLVFPIPLIALQLLRYLRGSIGERQLALTCGALVALLLSFSTELVLTTVIAVALVLLVSRLSLGSAFETDLRRLIRPLAWTAVVAAVLAAPLVLAAVLGLETDRINSPFHFSADAANLVVPTGITDAGGQLFDPISSRFDGNAAEDGTYLGLPLLLLCLFEARETWSRRSSRIAPVCVAVAILCALGPFLRVAGVPLLPLPWLALAEAPVFANILPVRLIAFAALAAGLCIATFLARRQSSPARIALVVLALAAPFPALASGRWRSSGQVPAALQGAATSRVLRPGEIVMVLPFGGIGPGMLWQASSDFRFRQAGGYLRPNPPAPYTQDPAVEKMVMGATPDPADLRAFLARSGVQAILVDPANEPLFAGTLDPLGITPEQVGGVLIYRLSRSRRAA